MSVTLNKRKRKCAWFHRFVPYLSLSARCAGQFKIKPAKAGFCFPNFARKRGRGGGRLCFGSEGEERGKMGSKERGWGRGEVREKGEGGGETSHFPGNSKSAFGGAL